MIRWEFTVYGSADMTHRCKTEFQMDRVSKDIPPNENFEYSYPLKYVHSFKVVCLILTRQNPDRPYMQSDFGPSFYAQRNIFSRAG